MAGEGLGGKSCPSMVGSPTFLWNVWFWLKTIWNDSNVYFLDCRSEKVAQRTSTKIFWDLEALGWHIVTIGSPVQSNSRNLCCSGMRANSGNPSGKLGPAAFQFLGAWPFLSTVVVFTAIFLPPDQRFLTHQSNLDNSLAHNYLQNLALPHSITFWHVFWCHIWSHM